FLLVISIFCSVAEDPSISGFVRSHIATRATGEDKSDIMLLENKLDLELKKRARYASFTASAEIIDRHINSGEDEDSLEVSLEELYMDISYESIDLRIGRQVVVWGKADGLFITDIVTPKDLRLFLMPEFEDMRLPVPMAKIDYYIAGLTLEAVIMPKFYPSITAEKGDWVFGGSNTGIEVPKTKPSANTENFEYGIRLSGFLLDTDYSILFLNTYSDLPVLRFREAEPSGDMKEIFRGLESFGISLPQYREPEFFYPDITVSGFTFSKPVSSFIIRGEAAVYKNDVFASVRPLPELTPDEDSLASVAEAIADSSGIPLFQAYSVVQDSIESLYKAAEKETGGELDSVPSGSVKKDYIHYMIGADYSGFNDYMVSMQFIQRVILDFSEKEGLLGGMGKPLRQYDNTLTFLIEGTYFQEKLKASMMNLYSLSTDDYILRPSIEYNISDAFWLYSGYDLIEGKKDTFFGQFDGNDNFYLKFKYSF
ncbi:MAG: DUF1302 family protein, partial [Fibrobacterota bacterium]